MCPLACDRYLNFGMVTLGVYWRVCWKWWPLKTSQIRNVSRQTKRAHIQEPVYGHPFRASCVVWCEVQAFPLYPKEISVHIQLTSRLLRRPLADVPLSQTLHLTMSSTNRLLIKNNSHTKNGKVLNAVFSVFASKTHA